MISVSGPVLTQAATDECDSVAPRISSSKKAPPVSWPNDVLSRRFPLKVCER